MSTHKLACVDGRAQSSPLAAFRDFQVLYQHFSKPAHTWMGTEREHPSNSDEGTGEISWKSKVEIHEMCLIHSAFSMCYQPRYLGVVLKLHWAKTRLWCPNQVIPGGLASQKSTHCTSAAQFGFETNYNPATGLFLRTRRALWVRLLVALFQMVQLWERKI